MLYLFYVYTSEEQNPEVMNLTGSIAKILRTLQLAIFLSSLLGFFFFFCRAIDFLSFFKLCESLLRSRKSEKHAES